MANLNQPPSKSTPNLLHVLDAFTDQTKTIVNTIIELNSNTINKYELITETGHLKLDRVGYCCLGYHFCYVPVRKLSKFRVIDRVCIRVSPIFLIIISENDEITTLVITLGNPPTDVIWRPPVLRALEGPFRLHGELSYIIAMCRALL